MFVAVALSGSELAPPLLLMAGLRGSSLSMQQGLWMAEARGVSPAESREVTREW